MDIVILTPERRHPVRVEDDKEGLHKAVAEIYEGTGGTRRWWGAQQLILVGDEAKVAFV